VANIINFAVSLETYTFRRNFYLSLKRQGKNCAMKVYCCFTFSPPVAYICIHFDVFILILVVVDPSPTTSNCRRTITTLRLRNTTQQRRQSTTPKLTSIIPLHHTTLLLCPIIYIPPAIRGQRHHIDFIFS
jgi:hypothetical protein